MQRFKKYVGREVSLANVKDSAGLNAFGMTCRYLPDPPEDYDEFEFVTEVCGVRINYLANQYNIVLDEGIYVSVDVYEYACPRYDTTKLIAYRITIEDVTVQLRDPQ
jgi:hypothetical protein